MANSQFICVSILVYIYMSMSVYICKCVKSTHLCVHLKSVNLKEFSMDSLKHAALKPSRTHKYILERDITFWPHCVEEGSIVYQSEQLVRCGHVMGHRFLPIVKEGVRGPDLTSQKIVQWKDLHRSIKFQSFIMPCLSKKYVNGVLLGTKKRENNVWVEF